MRVELLELLADLRAGLRDYERGKRRPSLYQVERRLAQILEDQDG